MKHLKSTFKTVFVAFLLLFSFQQRVMATTTDPATELSLYPDSVLEKMDSVEVSLLTCSPGKEVWSLYGHTAIRLVDKISHRDISINYGVFSFEEENFILRFVFGINDYMMGEAPTAFFLDSYKSGGRGIREQVLNLGRLDKLRFIQALVVNEQPQNIFYRYNYFFDNCTTRARDIITNALTGKLEYTEPVDNNKTFRSITHRYNENALWARFGNDILLGVNADKPTTRDDQQFLPDNLMEDFDHALYNGKPFVKESRWLLLPTAVADESIFPLSPWACGFILLAITIVITFCEWRMKKLFWLFDALLLLSSGLAGLILFVMIFSHHPTVSLNLQILVLNPLSLLFLFPVVKAARQQRSHWYFMLLGICCILAFVASYWQCFADGIHAVALSLLIRCTVRNLKKYRTTDK